jgi:hypothetical protein
LTSSVLRHAPPLPLSRQVRRSGCTVLDDLLAARPPVRGACSPKLEKAALRWLERYLVECSPRLQHFAQVAVDLAKLERD